VTLLRDCACRWCRVAAGTPLVLVHYATDARGHRRHRLRPRAPPGGGARRERAAGVGPRTSARRVDSLAAELPADARAVVMTYTRTFEGAGRLAIPAHVSAWIDGQAARTGRVVVVAGGNPYVIRQFPRVQSYMVTYGRGDALERAAARAVLGLAPIGGRAPISLPGYFQRGDGLVRGAAVGAR
jgi:beta-N-acetylhexosaminidase